jgi:hypothetical protein
VTGARERDWLCCVALALAVAGTVFTSGVFLDRTATERLLAFRPWGVLGLLLVAVELSARRRPVAVRGGGPPG